VFTATDFFAFLFSISEISTSMTSFHIRLKMPK